jgi:Protein of unknown function (DUF4232)
VNDIDQRVKDLLQRRADDLPPHRQVPAGLGRRARRRIVLNALAAGAAVVVVAVGVVVGVQALTGPSSGGPGGNPTQHSPAPSPSGGTGSVTTACTSSELRAVGAFEGAAGSREGAINLTNISDQACTLQGRPDIFLLDSAGNPITSSIDFMSAPAKWEKDAKPTPPGWPVVTLRPGASQSSVSIRWSNWCLDGGAPPEWRIGIPGSGAVVVTGLDTLGPPPCNGQGQPSTIEVGPFEPSR